MRIITINVGSPAWIKCWTAFHLKMAVKFSRLKYPADEQMMFNHLFEVELWSDKRPWGSSCKQNTQQ